MSTLEAALADFEARLSEAQKSADALARALRQLKRAAGAGHIVELEKGLAAIAQRAQQVGAAPTELHGAWSFDSRNYLERDYLDELRQEANSQGLTLVERDGRLFCFPNILRIEPGEAAVRIGRKRERRLRPKELVRQLATLQRSKPRTNSQRLLDAIYQVYRRVQGAAWQKASNGRGPVMPLAEIHETLTLLPGSDYPIEEFGRDLLILARQPDLRTRDGCSFDYVGSTMTRERTRRISAYDEHGAEKVFMAIRFVRGE